VKGKRFSEEQIVGVLKRLETGEKPKDLCREIGVHEQTLYNWKSKYGAVEVTQLSEFRAVNFKKMVEPEAKRKAAEFLETEFQFSERRACRLLHFPRATRRYCAKPNPRLHVLLRREGFRINHKRKRRYRSAARLIPGFLHLCAGL